MTKQEAIDFFGTKKRLAAALDTYPQAVIQWGEYPPILRQYQIEVITKGALKAEHIDYIVRVETTDSEDKQTKE